MIIKLLNNKYDKFSNNKLFILSIFFIIILLISCDDIKELEINGKKESEIIKEFGNPDNCKIFIISDSLYEYQYNLINLFPNYKNEKINIKEFIWKEKSKTLAVWLVFENSYWIVVDNVVWKKGIQF